MTDHISRQGIVDKVEAKRRKDEVVFLEATIRFDTALIDDYNYGDDMRIDKISVAFSPLAGINPGDIVHLDMSVTSPLTQRFRPALEAGTIEPDVEAEVMTKVAEAWDEAYPELGDEPEDQVTEADGEALGFNDEDDSHLEGQYDESNLEELCDESQGDV